MAEKLPVIKDRRGRQRDGPRAVPTPSPSPDSSSRDGLVLAAAAVLRPRGLSTAGPGCLVKAEREDGPATQDRFFARPLPHSPCACPNDIGSVGSDRPPTGQRIENGRRGRVYRPVLH
jgi:hypothetical protein